MGVEAKNTKGSPMTDSIILERVADAAADCLYGELVNTEDFQVFESVVAMDMRLIASRVLCKCIERFDDELCRAMPRGWSIHERAERTLITLVGEIKFKRTIYLDEFGRRRAWTDEILGIPPRSRLSACAFLWIATQAAEISYRKTAREFYKLTNACISHVTVMNVVHREGKLLRQSGAEYFCSGQKISQDNLFVETDGLWIHLQKSTHRTKALPRFLYEQARKTKSFELKMAALYAGKTKVSPGRYVRGGLCLTCLDGDVETFWDRVWHMTYNNYEIEDINRIAVGGDGADWCGSRALTERAPVNCQVDFTLDLFHVMKKIMRAYPEEDSAKRQWAINLALRGKGIQLARMCKRVAKKMSTGARRDKVVELATYIQNNVSGIRRPKHELGTIEATNAHIGAARCKNQGRSWSRKGAEAICLMRCALMSGRKLVAPSADSWFSKRELDARDRALAHKAVSDKASGSGWEYPHRSRPLIKKVAISLSCRS